MTIIKRSQAYIITTPLYVVVILLGVIVVVSLMAGSGSGSSSDSINNNGGGTATATSATTPCTTFVGGGVTAFVHSNTAVMVVGTITKSKYYTPLTLTLTANKNNNDNNDNRIIRSSSSRRRSKPYYDFTNINAAALLSRSTQSSLASSSLVSLASTSSFELNNDDYSKNHNKRRHNFKIDHTVDDNTDTDTDNRKLVDVVQVTLPSMERYRNLTSLKSNNNNKSDATKNDHSDNDFDIYDDEKISLNPIIRKYRRLVSQKQKNDGQQLQQKQQVMKKFFVFIRLLSYPFSLLSSILRRWCISIVSSQRKYYYFRRNKSNGYDDTFNRRNRNANVNIGGKKRHLILLLSSMLSGMFGIRPANIMCKSNGSGSGDVVASISRLEQTIHTHHHLDVSSYSSSSTTAYGREWLNKNNKLEKKKKKKNKI